MFRFLILKSKYLSIFLGSLFIGAIIYLAIAFFVNHGVKMGSNIRSQAPEKIGQIGIDHAKLEGELNLFVVTEKPVDLAHDSRGFFYFLNQGGHIVQCVREDSESQSLSKFYQVDSSHFIPEKGCTSLAIHPDYLRKGKPGFGKIYLTCAEKAGTGTVLEKLGEGEVEEYQEVIYELNQSDPSENRFSGSVREVLRISVGDENGPAFSDMAFDHEGLLYIGVRDSEISRASEVASIYGKVLRINPLKDDQSGQAYSSPRNNPFFFVKDSRPELWAYGLRNPHTISYDSFRNLICISDTGEEMLEEINVSESGAEFFGWNLAEGSFFSPLSEDRAAGDEVVKPQIEYSRDTVLGRNIGGVFYRGERFPQLDGQTIFADEKGRLMTAYLEPGKSARKISVLMPGRVDKINVRSLETGPTGEMFLLCDSGEIFEINKVRPISKNSTYRRTMMAAVLR